MGKKRNADLGKYEKDIQSIQDGFGNAPKSVGYDLPKAIKQEEKTNTKQSVKNAIEGVKTTVEVGLAVSNPIALAGIVAGKTINALAKGIKVKEIREIYQEKKALDEQKACNNIQTEITDKYPELKEFKDKPIKKDIDSLKKNQICMNSGQYETVSKDRIKTNIVEGVALEKTLDKSIEATKEAVKELLGTIIESPSPVGLAIKLGLKGADVVQDIGKIKSDYNKAVAINDAKEDINKTKKALFTENIKPYVNLEELQENTYEKKVVTAAFLKITEDQEKFNSIKNDHKKLTKAFNNAKEIAKKEIKELAKDNTLVSYVKDVARGMTIGDSKYSKEEIEFTDYKKLQDKFKNEGISSEKTSWDKFKKNVKDTINPEYEHKDIKHAKQLNKAVTMLYKGEETKHSDSKEVNDMVQRMQKQTKVSEQHTSAPESTPKSKSINTNQGRSV